MQLTISNELDRILLFAREEAARTGSASIQPDHLMLGILRHRECRACAILEELGIVPDEFKDYLDSINMHSRHIDYRDLSKIIPARKTDAILNLAGFVTLRHNLESILPEHLLTAIIEEGSSNAANFINENGIAGKDIEEAMRASGPCNESIVHTVTPAPPKTHFIKIGRGSKISS